MNRLIIISGSSGSIGQALSNEFLNLGYNVVGLDKRKASVKHGRYHHISIDLAKYPESVEDTDIVNSLIDQHTKGIDKLALINNAAMQIVKPVDKLTFKDFDQSIRINAISGFFLAQKLTPKLKELKGSILNISSVHAKLSKKDFSAYAASKSMLNALTKSLAIELSGYGVSVNAIAPAAVETNMLKDGFQNNLNALNLLKNFHPANKISTPKDVAKFARMIIEFDDNFLTGAIIDFDGGITSMLKDPG